MEYKKGIDRKFRLPRVWSNQELKKFAHLFRGNVINVSGWKDEDKEGEHYKNYFKNASSYAISNYKSEARGFQGEKGEIFLDLTKKLDQGLIEKYDVVFNHTVLEHIYEVHIAFANLCKLSNDIVIIVVPFLQQMHADYGDYWRFTPLTIKKMFEEQGMNLLYLSFNSEPNASVYLFAIGTKNIKEWSKKIPPHFSYEDPTSTGDGFENFVGCHAIKNERTNPSVKDRFKQIMDAFR
ncbi:hypothetical protein [Marinoscillum furvescens]|uniref:Methyltransferase family protein n=1 Tax=Marinoscillum furvescens DSM 4134 TaxID=1122208 RepID=A0A3D9L571_MARFU|nr:hypothetical protein [Marinoscillum furvescens]RED99544.1 hypothetical protein C7460_108166 [Marinoscillum furvescens DSM 4134]